MLLYVLGVFIVWCLWRMKDYVGHDALENFSDDLIPKLKNSYQLAYFNEEEVFMFPRNCAKKFKRSYRHYFFGLYSFEICRARDAEKILGSSKHIDKSSIYLLLEPFLKTGLLTSKGEKWHKRRRLLTPTFHFDILKEFLEVFKEESDRLVNSLEEKVGKNIDIIPVSFQFTLNTICESAMGVKLSELGNDGDVYHKNIYLIGKKLLYRLLRPWLMYDFIFAALGFKADLDFVLKPVHDFTKSIINQRRNSFFQTKKLNQNIEDSNVYYRSKKQRFAMMDTLLQAQQNGLIDDEGIMEETDTFTFEGHDTTSAAMTFTLLLLAHNPDVQEKVFEEIQEVLSESDKEELTIDDFNKMDYLDRVLKESMRIYPPVPFISRELSEDLIHDGLTHSKGSLVNIHIFDVHRDPEIFPDPEKFDPDRFLPENCANRSNFAYIAFSAGMRNCIGQRFALLELKTMLTKIIRSFRITPITKREEIIFFADIILRSRFPIKMIFNRRD